MENDTDMTVGDLVESLDPQDDQAESVEQSPAVIDSTEPESPAAIQEGSPTEPDPMLIQVTEPDPYPPAPDPALSPTGIPDPAEAPVPLSGQAIEPEPYRPIIPPEVAAEIMAMVPRALSESDIIAVIHREILKIIAPEDEKCAFVHEFVEKIRARIKVAS